MAPFFMKYVLKPALLISLCFFVLLTKSQSKIYLNAGIENSFPLSKFKDYYTHGIGASGEVDYRISEKVNLFFNASYLKYSFNTKNLDVTGNEAFLPMQFGGKLYVVPKIYFLAGGGVNLDFGNVITPYRVYHLGVGVEFFKQLSADLKYERTGTFDFTPKVIKIKIGYTFKFKRNIQF